MKNKFILFVLLVMNAAFLSVGVFAYNEVDIREEFYFDGKSLSEYSGKDSVLSLYSENAFVVNLDTGCVVYEKNGNKKAYPASTVKLLTAIVAYEKIENIKVNTK